MEDLDPFRAKIVDPLSMKRFACVFSSYSLFVSHSIDMGLLARHTPLGGFPPQSRIFDISR